MSTEYPRLVSVETTNRCNAKCAFCPNSALKRKREIMDDDLFRKIIEDCTEFPLQAIEPFLQGEPFVDPKIFDRLELIRSKLPETALRLYSNGAALTPKKADLLRELGADKLYISLNTIDPERYNRIVGLPFQRTMENITYLAGNHEKGKVADKIIVRLTATEETTTDEKKQFSSLCKGLGVKPMISGLFNYKGDIHSNLPVPNFPCEHITRLDILVSGETTLCCMDQNGEYGWGSVRDKSVVEVYNGRRANHFRTMQRSNKRHELPPCDRCNLFWPSLTHMSLPRTIQFSAKYLAYLIRHRPIN